MAAQRRSTVRGLTVLIVLVVVSVGVGVSMWWMGVDGDGASRELPSVPSTTPIAPG